MIIEKPIWHKIVALAQFLVDTKEYEGGGDHSPKHIAIMLTRKEVMRELITLILSVNEKED